MSRMTSRRVSRSVAAAARGRSSSRRASQSTPLNAVSKWAVWMIVQAESKVASASAGASGSASGAGVAGAQAEAVRVGAEVSCEAGASWAEAWRAGEKAITAGSQDRQARRRVSAERLGSGWAMSPEDARPGRIATLGSLLLREEWCGSRMVWGQASMGHRGRVWRAQSPNRAAAIQGRSWLWDVVCTSRSFSAGRSACSRNAAELGQHCKACGLSRGRVGMYPGVQARGVGTDWGQVRVRTPVE